jgi:uncharacterized iron-regulated membrane protein
MVEFVIAMTVLCAVAVVTGLAVWSPRETERQRIARETREAEAQIIAVSRTAQAAIISEAIQRATDPSRR